MLKTIKAFWRAIALPPEPEPDKFDSVYFAYNPETDRVYVEANVPLERLGDVTRQWTVNGYAIKLAKEEVNAADTTEPPAPRLGEFTE